jgi:hypothetical protein
MINKKKITELLKERCEIDKKFIDSHYNDEVKKNIEKRYRKDFPIDKVKKLIDEECIIELNKENSYRCDVHLKGNHMALLFCLYMLEDSIKKEYAIPEPLADIIKLIKNDDYNQEVYNINE